MAAHLLLISFHNPIGLVALGLAFSLFVTAIWPTVPMLVPERLTGTAYGILVVVLNVFIGLVPLWNAFLLTYLRQGYTPVLLSFSTMALSALALSAWMERIDGRRELSLNSTD